jgi:hypothetical protein
MVAAIVAGDGRVVRTVCWKWPELGTPRRSIATAVDEHAL